MEINIELIVSVLIAIGGIIAALVTEEKYRKARENILEFIGDLADFLAMVYDASKNNTLANKENQTVIVSKIEEIWTDLEALGPSFSDLLEKKSSVIEATKKVQK